ncbi:MAG: F0F1 ATP synthase subunit delta [Candidatus Nomurabacteria bacterium]|nr:MAG: F0F1 ATP synthase subunit delta [Candidatus Nomurabacteria bacterium]
MAGVRLSRRKVAAYFADELLAGRSVTKELAAYLVEAKRTRETVLFVRDIEAALSDRGVLLADIASSRELTADTEAAVSSFLKHATNAKQIHLRSSVDPTLLGGVRIETPDQRLDMTLRHRLNQLTASKI